MSPNLEDAKEVKISFAPRFLFVEGLPSAQTLAKTLKAYPDSIQKILILNPSSHSVPAELNQENIEVLSGFSPEEFWQRTLQIFSERQYARSIDAHLWIANPEIKVSSPDRARLDEYRRQWESVVSVVKEGFGSDDGTLLGLRNTLGNLPNILSSPGIHGLRDLFSGMKGVVVSTGPSLIHSLAELKNLQDKILIFCPDASLKILLENGITPHFVLSMERVSGSEPYFEKAKFETAKRSMHLVAFSIVPPGVLEAFPGPKWICYREEEIFAIMDQQLSRGFLPCGHSVAHQALGLADWVGCSEVYLVGQDLSFDPKTLQSHPDGIAYSQWSESRSQTELEEDLKSRGEWLLWMPGNLEEQVPTSNLYALFNKEFTQMLPRIRAKVFNSTQGGAKIEGFSWRALKELSRSPLLSFSKNPFDLLEEVFRMESESVQSSAFNPALIIQYLQKRLKELEHMRDETKAILNGFATGVSNKENLSGARMILSSLAAEKESLVNDRIFIALFSHYLGARWIEIENQFATLPMRIEDRFQPQLRLLKVWTESHIEIGKKVLEIFLQFRPSQRPALKVVP